MSTQDCPGANPAHADVLAAGCWAEHEDGSLIYVKGTEGGQVVYEIYDVAQDPPVMYQDAMRESDFKTTFSYPPIGKSDIKWTWHDKTPFPWNRVMKSFDKPRPQYADVHDTLSAASKVAESLRLRSHSLHPEGVGHMTEEEAPRGRGIIDKIQKSLDAAFRAWNQ